MLNKHAEEAIERENSEGEAVTISDAGELKKMVPGNDTAAPASVEPPSAKASSAFAPHLTSKEPAAESTTPPTSGQSLPTQPSQEQQQPKSETVTPVGSSSSNRPTTAVPAAADVTAQPASSASRDSQQR
ncbi:hypothetical protein ACVW1D_001930 [Ewingella americana]